jgi:hypothetical protein
VLAEAEKGEETLLGADLDPAQVRAAGHSFDPAGHYSRPDVVRLTVDRGRREPVHFTDRPLLSWDFACSTPSWGILHNFYTSSPSVHGGGSSSWCSSTEQSAATTPQGDRQ